MTIESWTHQSGFSNSFIVVDEDDAVTNLEAVSYISYNASFGPVGLNSECLVNLKSLNFSFCRSGDMIMRQYLEDIFQLWHRICVFLILIGMSVFPCGF